MVANLLLKSGGNFMTEAILKQQNELPIQMTYKKNKHIELVKRFMDFKKQGKNVSDLYLEKRDEYLELSRYQCMVNDCIFWTRRKEFVLCMENYVHDFIDFEHFEIAFSRLWKESMKAYNALKIDLKGLKNFELDPKSDGFGRFVTFVYRQFEVLED
jgi:hypothetical protein